MALADTAQLAVQLTLDDRRFTGPLNRVQSRLKGLDKGFSNTQRALGRTSGALQRTAAIAATAVTGGFLYAVHAAGNFQDAFQGIVKTVQATPEEFDVLRAKIRQMALEMPIAATELAAIGETAGALGIRTADIDDFIGVVAKLGATTTLTTDEAAEGLGKIGTILNLTGRGFENFADIVVNLGNQGASTESEIVEITKRFAAAGKAAGLTIPEILGFASAIASAGVEPEAAGSSLSRLFGNLITETALGSKKAEAFAQVAGLSFKDFAKVVKNDTGDAMLLFLDHLRKLGKFKAQKALKAVGITNVRDRNAILLLAQTYDNRLIPSLEAAEHSVGALGKEAAKRFDTFNSKVQIAKNTLNDIGITVGDRLLPKITPLLDEFGNWVATHGPDIERFGDQAADAFTGLVDAAKKLPWTQIIDGLKVSAALTGGLIKAFTSLPGPLQGLLLTGFVANKVTGGLVGALGQDIGGLVFNKIFTGAFLTRGTPANPMFVVPVGGTLGPGGGAGVPATGLGLLGLTGLAGAIAVALHDAPLIGTNFVGGINAAKGGDAGGLLQSMRNIATGLAAIPAPLQNLFGLLSDDAATRIARLQSEAAVKAAASEVGRAADKRETNRIITQAGTAAAVAAAEKTRAALTQVRDRNEANAIARIAQQVSPLRWKPSSVVQVEDRRGQTKDDVVIGQMLINRRQNEALRERIEASRIATQSGLSGAKTAIVGGLNRLATTKPNINVNVQVNGLSRVTTIVRTGTTLTRNVTSTGFNVRPGIPE